MPQRRQKGILITVLLVEKWPFIRQTSIILRKAGVKIAEPLLEVFNGQEVEVWPRITWIPKWASTFAELKQKVKEGCSISQRSTMSINGHNIFLEGLFLDGTLLVNAIDEAEVKLTGSVQNKGWELEHITYKDNIMPEEVRMRGFRIKKIEQLELNYKEPGSFCLES